LDDAPDTISGKRKSTNPTDSQIKTSYLDLSATTPKTSAFLSSFKSQSTIDTKKTPEHTGELVKTQSSGYILEKPKDELTFPLTAGKALKHFMSDMTDYEKGEILNFKEIYFIGKGSTKIKGSPLNPINYGYDDDRGDYNIVLKDHIGYRYEVVDFLGKGSFGQAVRVFDHKKKECIALKIIRNKKKFQH
jgi:dual specificity tyrosine-phosphorylation-regulated kinase 2/3/4